jgi:hypothetical protein
LEFLHLDSFLTTWFFTAIMMGHLSKSQWDLKLKGVFMKTIMVLASLLVSQLSLAQIAQSTLSPGHQKVIAAAVEARCGVAGSLTELSAIETERIPVDNGITDIRYLVQLSMLVRVDQNFFEERHVSVRTFMADMYDHGTQEWGSYSVENVSSHDMNCN